LSQSDLEWSATIEADGIGLSAKGYERAAALAFNSPVTFGKIDHLFATQESAHSDRPVQTITPLAAALNLKINSDFKDDHFQEIADHILDDPKYSGERILICWPTARFHNWRLHCVCRILHVPSGIMSLIACD
jgi:hypothetical protein